MKLLATSALLAMIAAAPASAGTVTTSIAVSPVGLDLASASGAAAMAGRIERAAVRACGASSFSVRDYQAAVKRSDCFRDAVTNAQAALNAPAVSAALRERAAPSADQ
ncbi:UrcA family protein [Phenylobacterium sp.]|uniref:UrcA family protein n=1 Tax=Phenylobacterium sp. TaxID=1871053 RepID=UPI0025F98547|nr:UrcA family protein [Phenylobacterium sp.]